MNSVATRIRDGEWTAVDLVASAVEGVVGIGNPASRGGIPWVARGKRDFHRALVTRAADQSAGQAGRANGINRVVADGTVSDIAGGAALIAPGTNMRSMTTLAHAASARGSGEVEAAGSGIWILRSREE